MGDDLQHESREPPRELIAPVAGRLDAVLAAACPGLSRARLQRLIAGGAVSVNGERVRKSARVQPGDRIALEVPATEHEARATGLQIGVLYEDDALIAIDKPAGVVVHGASGDGGPSVAAWFVEHWPAAARAFDVLRPGIVHRLDKDTSGVLLLAKTPIAQGAFSAAFASRQTQKTYVAVCDGVPARPRALIDAPLGRHPGDRTRMAIARQGREARTEYEVIASGGGRSLLVVRPETGRTHQIRVHLAAVGVPVALDRVYGTAGVGRQLLHAWRITVPHPGGGTLTITAPLPSDMAAAVRAMGAEALAAPFIAPAPPSREPGTRATAEEARAGVAAV